jgi:hypothetical protein
MPQNLLLARVFTLMGARWLILDAVAQWKSFGKPILWRPGIPDLSKPISEVCLLEVFGMKWFNGLGQLNHFSTQRWIFNDRKNLPIPPLSLLHNIAEVLAEVDEPPDRR